MRKSGSLPPVLVIGAHTMGLAILRAFKDLEIERVFLSYDPEDMGRVSRYEDRVFDIPHPETSIDQFVEFMLKLGEVYPGAVLFPASDPSLKAVSMEKQALSEKFMVACPGWNIIELVIDKKKTYEVAEKYGIPCPKTIHPHSEDEVQIYARKAAFPILIKPSQSHLYFDIFHRKMILANNIDELIKAYQQASIHGLEVVIQEYIPGDDSKGVNYNTYAIDGEVQVEFTAAKIRNAPPHLGSPCVAKSAYIPDVYEIGRKMVKALSFDGYSCSEYKLDPRDGVHKLMEVNGRHNLSGQLAVKCGLNFPLLHYLHLVTGKIPEQNVFTTGKYWIDLTRDTAYHLPAVLKGQLTPGKFLEPYLSDHTFAILDGKDLRPFLKRSSSLLMNALKQKRTI